MLVTDQICYNFKYSLVNDFKCNNLAAASQGNCYNVNIAVFCLLEMCCVIAGSKLIFIKAI